MKQKYLYTLFFFIHVSISAIPTCYISFDQLEQHRLHPADLWPTQQYKHYNHYNSSYSAPVSLPNYSMSDLQLHFDTNGYSEKDILSYDTMYMSDEFVQLVKTYPGYEEAIAELYNKLKRLWWFQKGARYLFSGTYYPNLLEQTRHLYKELREYQLIATENAKSFAQLYDINLLALFPHNSSLVTRDIYKNYMEILHRTSDIPTHNSIIRDCIGQASIIGLEANKHGHIKYASQL